MKSKEIFPQSLREQLIISCFVRSTEELLLLSKCFDALLAAEEEIEEQVNKKEHFIKEFGKWKLLAEEKDKVILSQISELEAYESKIELLKKEVERLKLINSH